MPANSVHIDKIEAPLSAEGREVMKDFFDNKHNIIISASAGTGKTTLLTNILVKTVIREVEERRNYRVFDEIVAVTFTVEAARQMKEKVRRGLEKYFTGKEDVRVDKLLQSLESESWISTLDALTARLVRLVSIDFGLPPDVDIAEAYQSWEMQRCVLRTLRRTFPESVELLEQAFSDSWESILEMGMRLAAMYLVNPDDLLQRMEGSFRLFYEHLAEVPDLESNQISSLQEYNREILDAFSEVFRSYLKLMDNEFTKSGAFTYDWLRKRLVEYLNEERAEYWIQYLHGRFRFVFVDEYQDTSRSQAILLSQLVGRKCQVMAIGDPKQSIYAWRNAEPQIFMDMISAADDRKRDPYFKRRFYHHPITDNFRSVEPLVEMANAFFGSSPDSIFNADRFTAGYKLPHPDIACASVEIPTEKEMKPPHIHYYGPLRKVKIPEEDFTTGFLGEVLAGTSNLRIRKKIRGKWKWARPDLGDCAILIPRRTNWRLLRGALVDREIPFVMIADKGFYRRPEISLMIDFLDWLGDPYKKDALLRILRSPFVGVSDVSLRILGERYFRLDETETELARILDKETIDPDVEKTIKRDLIAISRVYNLKNNLRWSREGRKAELIERILTSSHFREIIMIYPEGSQCVVNLNLLCDIVESWEEEELISYSEVTTRLRFYRSSGDKEQSQAVLSDIENKDAVKVATIHATKGLDFPVVFVYDPDFDQDAQWRFFNCGFGDVEPQWWFTGSFGEFIHLRQVEKYGVDFSFRSIFYDIYCRKPEVAKSEFRLYIKGIYDDFIAEKWRLYYVALTRARDHIFHSYKYAGGSAIRWGNEFRDRIEDFRKSYSRGEDCVEQIEEPPAIPGRPLEGREPLSVETDPTIDKIRGEFSPASLDPTHIYDLIRCPRRYQYTALAKARGARCYEVGFSGFSWRFGQLVHDLIERYDYEATDHSKALEYLETIDELDLDEKRFLAESIAAFSPFIQDLREDLGLKDSEVAREKAIYAHLDANGHKMFLRGKMDVVMIADEEAFIFDIKTNYPSPKSGDSEDMRTYKDFLREHHEYQLLTYRVMLEALDVKVNSVFILSLQKVLKGGPVWRAIRVEVRADFEEKLKKMVELKVDDDGLIKVQSDLCAVCEFRKLCW